MKTWIGRNSERLQVEPASSAVELRVKPRWSNAEIRFPKQEDSLFVGASSNPGYMHIVEVTVPVTIESKPQSIFIRAMAWFKNKPEIVQTKKLESDILSVFKNSMDIALEDAFTRYKTLMLHENGATNIEINLSREGRDIIIVDRISLNDRKHS
jgi:hypothetical protein